MGPQKESTMQLNCICALSTLARSLATQSAQWWAKPEVNLRTIRWAMRSRSDEDFHWPLVLIGPRKKQHLQTVLVVPWTKVSGQKNPRTNEGICLYNVRRNAKHCDAWTDFFCCTDLQPFRLVVVFGGGWLCFSGVWVVVTWCAVMWYGVTRLVGRRNEIISVGFGATWGEVMWVVVTSCGGMLGDVMWCEVMWWCDVRCECQVVWLDVMSCDAMGHGGKGWGGLCGSLLCNWWWRHIIFNPGGKPRSLQNVQCNDVCRLGIERMDSKQESSPEPPV